MEDRRFEGNGLPGDTVTRGRKESYANTIIGGKAPASRRFREQRATKVDSWLALILRGSRGTFSALHDETTCNRTEARCKRGRAVKKTGVLLFTSQAWKGLKQCSSDRNSESVGPTGRSVSPSDGLPQLIGPGVIPRARSHCSAFRCYAAAAPDAVRNEALSANSTVE